MKGFIRPTFTILTTVLLGTGVLTAVAQAQTEHDIDLSINLKAKALVLGPKIRLGDIGVLVIADSSENKTLAEKLALVEVGDAPPPGESREISIYYIKRCLKKAGFGDFVSRLNGPRTVRVTTAAVEVDKARLEDSNASIHRCVIDLENLLFNRRFRQIYLNIS